MYGIAIEYVAEVPGTPPDPLERAACHTILVRLPGYHRRLALMADGWRRIVDLFLFTSPEATRAALASDNWRTFAAAHPACRDAAPALLVSESRYGDLVVLLRGMGSPTNGGQGCWRDHLTATDPKAVLW